MIPFDLSGNEVMVPIPIRQDPTANHHQIICSKQEHRDGQKNDTAFTKAGKIPAFSRGQKENIFWQMPMVADLFFGLLHNKPSGRPQGPLVPLQLHYVAVGRM